MLRELVKRWANHKIMVRWLSRFFHYLDRYFIARRSLPPLHEVGLTCFRDLVIFQYTLNVVEYIVEPWMMLCQFFLSANHIIVRSHNYIQFILLLHTSFNIFSFHFNAVLLEDKLMVFYFFQVYKELNGKVRDAVISLVCFPFYFLYTNFTFKNVE